MNDKKLDKEDFMDLINQNQGIIHKVSFLYASSPEDREDLFQDICFQLWKSNGTYRKEAKYSTWLYRVAINTAITRFRKRKRDITIMPLEGIQYSDNSPERDPEVHKLLIRAISGLNKIDKAIILLWLEEKKYEEIAEILGISRGNVSVKLVRIKKELIKKMKSLK